MRPEILAVALEVIKNIQFVAVVRVTVSVLAPGPVRVMSEEISGSKLVRVIEPVKPVRSTVSEPLLLPAAHSPATAPDAVLVFAAMIASRRVHRPSALSGASEVLLTVIVLPATATTTDVWLLVSANTTEIEQMKVKSRARIRK